LHDESSKVDTHGIGAAKEPSVRKLDSNGSRPQDPNDREDRRLVKGSIFGTLSDEEQLEFDRRFIETPTFADLAFEVESDLVDAYAAGELSAEDREAVRRWSLRSSKNAFRLQSAAVLRDVMQTAKHETSEPVPRRLLGLFSPFQMSVAIGVVAALLITVTTTVLYKRRSSFNEARQSSHDAVAPTMAQLTLPAPSGSSANTGKVETPKEQHSLRAAKTPIFTAMILASENRDSSTAQVITVPSATKAIELQLSSAADIPPGRYSILLTSAGEEKKIWQKPDIYHSQGSFLSTRIPVLPNGSYLLTLRPAKSNRDGEPLSFQFTIARP